MNPHESSTLAILPSWGRTGKEHQWLLGNPRLWFLATSCLSAENETSKDSCKAKICDGWGDCPQWFCQSYCSFLVSFPISLLWWFCHISVWDLMASPSRSWCRGEVTCFISAWVLAPPVKRHAQKICPRKGGPSGVPWSAGTSYSSWSRLLLLALL